MKSKKEIIEIMAKAIYDRQEGLKGVWMPQVPGLCDVYLDTAEAALEALCEALPDVPEITFNINEHKHTNIDIYELEDIYNQLKQYGENKNED